MLGQIKDLSIGMEGDIRISLSLPRQFIEELSKLKDKPVDVAIKRYSKKRSTNANNLMWTICQQSADWLNEEAKKLEDTPKYIPPKERKPLLTSMDIYRDAVRKVGSYQRLPIRIDQVDKFSKNFAMGGDAWFVVVIDDSKIKNHKNVEAYWGSSTYDTEEMSALLDYLIDNANQMGLVLKATPAEIAEAKRRWGV